jgi:maleate cis-trans isomerase
MYGWKARIGYITPSNTLETPAYEFFRMAPEGVVMVGSCLNIDRVTPDSVDGAWSRVCDVAAGVAQYRVDLIVVAGAPLAYVRGPGAHRLLEAEVTAASGVPSFSEITATVEALQHLGAQRIAIASPFAPSLNDALGSFMESEGFEVLAMEGLGLDSNSEITMLPIRASYDVARAVRRRAPTADAIYVTCPRWPVAPNLQDLEDDLGIAVVGSIQSILWKSLRHLGLRSQVPNYGKLLWAG